MKKFKTTLLALPLLFTLGACNVNKDGESINIDSFISGISVPDDVADFIYDNSTASNSLKALAEQDGYAISYRVENEVLPDDYDGSNYFDVTLYGKGNLTWAKVNQKNKDDTEIISSYEALLEEDTNTAYYKDIDGWHIAGSASYGRYSITDLKNLLIISGEYLSLLTMTGVIKTRVTEINRECIKYRYDNDPNSLTIIVDRKTQLITHMTNISYTDQSVYKTMVKVSEFLEEAPNAPEYK